MGRLWCDDGEWVGMGNDGGRVGIRFNCGDLEVGVGRRWLGRVRDSG